MSTLTASTTASLVTRILHLPITSDAEAFVTVARATERVVVRLTEPGPEHRGNLCRFVVHGIEGELGRLGAAPAGHTDGDAIEAILGDQLYRARLLGCSGLALSFASLASLADHQGRLGEQDSTTLRRLVALAEQEPLQLYLPRPSAELHVVGHPHPLSAWLPPAIQPGAVASIEYDLQGDTEQQPQADLGMTREGPALVPPRVEAFVEADAGQAPCSCGAADEAGAPGAGASWEASAWNPGDADGTDVDGGDADGSDADGGALRYGALRYGAPGYGAPGHGAPGKPTDGAPPHRAPTDGALTQRASTDGAPPHRASTDGAPTHRAPTDGAPTQRASTAETAETGVAELHAGAPRSAADLQEAEAPRAAAPAPGAIEPAAAQSDDPASSEGDDEAAAAAKGRAAWDAPLECEEEPLEPDAEPSVHAHATRAGASFASERAARSVDHDGEADSPQITRPASADPAPEQSTTPDPEQTRRCLAWAAQLQGMSGPKAHGSVEKAFITAYLPLCREASAGTAPAEARAAAEKWAEGFAQSYASAFRQLHTRTRRPLMVRDVVDLGLRWMGQHPARQCQLLLVSGMRFDLGQRLNEEVERRFRGAAMCAEQSILWTALPSNPEAQLLGFGDSRRNERAHEAVRPPLDAAQIQPFLVGNRELFRLSLVLDDLPRAGEPESPRLERLAVRLADSIVPWMQRQPPDTLIVVFGDHGFHWQASPSGTSAAQRGGALPEQVLVPASAWLTRAPRAQARVAPGVH